jgi:hypothetical protein
MLRKDYLGEVARTEDTGASPVTGRMDHAAVWGRHLW